MSNWNNFTVAGKGLYGAPITHSITNASHEPPRQPLSTPVAAPPIHGVADDATEQFAEIMDKTIQEAVDAEERCGRAQVALAAMVASLPGIEALKADNAQLRELLLEAGDEAYIEGECMAAVVDLVEAGTQMSFPDVRQMIDTIRQEQRDEWAQLTAEHTARGEVRALGESWA